MISTTVGETVIVHKDRFAYISHPSITILDNGEWVAAFNHSRRREGKLLHPPDDPLYRTLLCRSADKGATWDEPTFAPGFDWYGTECPGLATLGDGTVVLSQFRFAWYPLETARKRRAAGERIFLNLPERRWPTSWIDDFTDADWSRSCFTWARGYHGVYVHLSSDNALTFERTVKLDTANFVDGYSRTGVVELADGRIAYAVTEHHPPVNRYTYLFMSSDGGVHWDAPIVIYDDPDRQFGEPDLAEVSPGELYCVLRCSGPCMYGCRSTDGGLTWSQPEPTGLRGCPGHLLVLKDGRLLCTYGRREEPFGIRMCLSEDGGKTWLTDSEIVIRDDLPNDDLGYPTTIEYESGTLFVCYYGQTADGVTCVQGTHVTLNNAAKANRGERQNPPNDAECAS